MVDSLSQFVSNIGNYSIVQCDAPNMVQVCNLTVTATVLVTAAIGAKCLCCCCVRNACSIIKFNAKLISGIALVAAIMYMCNEGIKISD